MGILKSKSFARVLSVLLCIAMLGGLLPVFSVSALDEGWIAAEDYDQLELGVDYDYSFAVLGDIQHITDYTPQDLPYLFDYILDNKDAKNIQFVFGMGDTTNDVHNEANNLVEWQLAKEQFFRFNGEIPYTVIRGNHDSVVRMNNYLGCEGSGYVAQLDGFYQEGNVVNAWKEFSVGGVDYLSLVINYESSDGVLEWASDVIEAHPNHRVILGTHVYLQPDGTYDNEMNPNFAQDGTINNANQVWDNLVSQHENIFLVLSGHESSDDVMILQKTGVHGNTVTEMRVDSQYTDLVYMLKDDDLHGGTEKGVGMVTMMYFKNDGTQVAVEHYSVLRDWYRALQTFEIDEYEHDGWRYDATDDDSYNVDAYAPSTGLTNAPEIWQEGLGDTTLDELMAAGDLSYEGGSATIRPDYNQDLGGHSFALHSGKRTVSPSSTYTVSYKLRSDSETVKVWPYIHSVKTELGGSDTYIPLREDPYLQKGPFTDWTTVSFDLTTDEKTSAVEIYLTTVGGEVFIDDFSMVKKAASDGATGTGNFVTNGGFELGTAGQAPTDTGIMGGGGTGSHIKVEGAGPDGSAAVQVTSTEGTYYFRPHTGSLPATANSRYKATYKIKLTEGARAWPFVCMAQASKWTPYNDYEVVGTADSDWVQVEAYFPSFDAVTYFEFNIFVTGGTALIDDVVVCECPLDIVNGNFENGSVGWGGSNTYGNDGTWAIVQDADRGGVLKEVAGNAGMSAMTKEENPYYAFVEPNKQYTISYWLKMEEDDDTATPVFSGIYTRQKAKDGTNGSRAWGFPAEFQRTGATDGWVKVEEVYTADEKAELLTIIFRAVGGTAYFDDLKIEEVSDTSNIITNGDFEQGTDGQFPTGFYSMQTGGKGKVEKVSGAGVDGSAAVRVEPRPGYILKTDDAHRITVTPSATYTLSYNVRVKNAVTDVYPIVRQFAANGTALETLTLKSAVVRGKTDWKQVTVTFTTNASAAQIALGLQAYGGQVDVDNLSLTDANGAELVYNGDFGDGANADGTPIGFTGEFVQGLQQGKVLYVSSARPHTLIVEAKSKAGVLNAYSDSTLLGTLDQVYGDLEHRAHFGVRIDDAATAAALADWVVARHVANLQVISADTALLATVKTAKPAVCCVVDCTDKAIEAVSAGSFTRVMIAESIATKANISKLRAKGLSVVVEATEVTEDLLIVGANAILTADAVAGILALENTAVSAVAAFAGATVTLGDDLDLNFYLDIPDEIKTEGMKVTFTLDGVAMPEVVLGEKETSGYYLASVEVPAKDMTAPVVATLVSADGNTVYATITYTIKEYAEYIIADPQGAYSENQEAAAKAMLTFGGYAQVYFDNHRGDDLANANYSVDLSGADLSGISKMQVNGAADGFIGATLMLKTKTAVRLNFNKAVEGAVARPNSAYYYVQIDGVGAAKLGSEKAYTIDGTTYIFSVLSFAKTVIEGNYPAEYQNLMKAMVIYADSAKDLTTEDETEMIN